MIGKMVFPLALALLVQSAPSVYGASVVVERVTANLDNQSWSFSVTLRHPDTGWDHYADGWEIVDDNVNRLGYRELLHPHVHEQPFTRSLSGVAVPQHLDHVFIRARDNFGVWSRALFRVELAP